MSIRSILARLRSGLWRSTATAPLELPPAVPPIPDKLEEMLKICDALDSMKLNTFTWDKTQVRFLVEAMREIQAEIREINSRLRFR